MSAVACILGCGEVEAPPMPEGPVLILSAAPECDLTGGGVLDSLDGLMAVSSHPIDDKQAQTESANGWEYVSSLIKDGRATGVNVYIDEPHPQIAEKPPIVRASSFSLTSLFK